MAAPTEVYIDPAIAGDSGTGVIGDPYGDVQYALNTQTRDATNGDRFNIKAGTAEILAGTLSFATYGSPTQDAPLIFEGYTSAAGDGGIGVCNGNSNKIGVFPSYTHSNNMRWYGSGVNFLLDIGAHGKWINTQFDDTDEGITSGTFSLIMNCYFTNMGWIGCSPSGDVIGCYFKNGTRDFLRAIDLAGAMRSVIAFNAFNLDGSSVGIFVRERSNVILANLFKGGGGTGTGIELDSSGADVNAILNNIIEGFSGAGGEGILVDSGSTIGVYGYNRFYNNTTHQSGVSGNVKMDLGTNTEAGSSAFAASGDDFTLLEAITGAWPSQIYGSSTPLDLWAVYREAAAGGGGGSHIIGG